MEKKALPLAAEMCWVAAGAGRVTAAVREVQLEVERGGWAGLVPRFVGVGHPLEVKGSQQAGETRWALAIVAVTGTAQALATAAGMGWRLVGRGLALATAVGRAPLLAARLQDPVTAEVMGLLLAGRTAAPVTAAGATALAQGRAQPLGGCRSRVLGTAAVRKPAMVVLQGTQVVQQPAQVGCWLQAMVCL